MPNRRYSGWRALFRYLIRLIQTAVADKLLYVVLCLVLGTSSYFLSNDVVLPRWAVVIIVVVPIAMFGYFSLRIHNLGVRRRTVMGSACFDILDAIQNVMNRQPTKSGADDQRLVEHGILRPAANYLTNERIKKKPTLLAVFIPSDGYLTIGYSWGLRVSSQEDYRALLKGCFCNEALEKNKRLVEDNAEIPLRFSGTSQSYPSYAALPIRTGKKAVAVLVALSPKKYAFGEPEVGFLNVVAGTLETAWPTVERLKGSHPTQKRA